MNGTEAERAPAVKFPELPQLIGRLVIVDYWDQRLKEGDLGVLTALIEDHHIILRCDWTIGYAGIIDLDKVSKIRLLPDPRDNETEWEYRCRVFHLKPDNSGT